MKKPDLIKAAAKFLKKREQTKLMNVRLTPEEIEEIKNAGYGCITAGIRRMMSVFKNRK